jgi:hypothetical protein
MNTLPIIDTKSLTEKFNLYKNSYSDQEARERLVSYYREVMKAKILIKKLDNEAAMEYKTLFSCEEIPFE